MYGKWKRLYGKQIMAAFMSLVAMISSIGFSLWTDKDYWSVDYIYPIDDKKKAKIVEKSLASVVLK